MAAPDKIFYTTFFGEIDGRLSVFVQEKATDVIAVISPVVLTMLGIYIILWGFSVAYGKVQEPVADGVWRIVRIAAILGLALNLGFYNHYIADVVTGLPDDLTRIIASSDTGVSNFETGAGAASALDIAFSNGWGAGKQFWDDPNFPYIGDFILAGVIWLVTILLTAYGAFLLLLAKMATVVLLAIGPIYIVLLMFQSTAKFFDSWLSQLINFMVLQIVTIGLLSLILGLFQGASDGAASERMAMDQVAFLVVTGLLGILVIVQAPSIASGISGGASLGTQGAFGIAMRALGRQTARGLNNSPVGRAFERPQAAREAARRMQAMQSGRQLLKDRETRSLNRSETFRRMGGAVKSGAASAYQSGRSAATTGLQKLAAMRANLSNRDDRWGRTTISNRRDP
jgi:type IV secretion system protein VirB6